MSKSEQHEVPDLDSRDYEREFYTVMADAAPERWPRVDHVQRDLFDATLGDQAGILGDGNVAVLLTCSQKGAVLLSGAVDHWVEHGCPESVHLAMYLLARIGHHVNGLLPSLTDVADFEPFNH